MVTTWHIVQALLTSGWNAYTKAKGVHPIVIEADNDLFDLFAENVATQVQLNKAVDAGIVFPPVFKTSKMIRSGRPGWFYRFKEAQ